MDKQVAESIRNWLTKNIEKLDEASGIENK